MKGKITALIIALAFIGGTVYLGASAYRYAIHGETPVDQVVGGGFSLDNAFYLTPGATTSYVPGQKTATTSTAFLETGDTATSTISGYAGLASNIDLYLDFNASTTASKLQYFVSFSFNKIDWFKEDCSQVDSTVLVTHGATACVHEWTPGVAGRNLKNITIGATQAKYFKIDFGVTGANGSLWTMAVPREETPN